MPHLLDHEGHSGGGKGADKKKQDLIVAGTLALVVLGYLTLKHMGGSGQGSTAGVPGSATDLGGGVGGGGGGTDLSGLSGQLQGIQNSLNGLAGRGNREHGTTPTTATPPTTTTPKD